MRLIVTDPAGSGKSTFIRSISEIQVLDANRQAIDQTTLITQKNNLALDFGRLTFGVEMVLHLYGTPVQERFYVEYPNSQGACFDIISIS